MHKYNHVVINYSFKRFVLFNRLKSEENGIRWNMHCQKNKQNNEYIMAVIECISSGMFLSV